jgi:hypothetical protein
LIRKTTDENKLINPVAKTANRETINAKFSYEWAFGESMFTSSNQ